MTDFCHARIKLWFTTKFLLGMRVVFVSQSGVLILPGTSEKCLVPHEWYKILEMIT